jgi:hypothetical protein
VPRDDDRGRQVRTWLLVRGVVLGPAHRYIKYGPGMARYLGRRGCKFLSHSLILLAMVAMALPLVFAKSAHASELLVPPGFRLHASNGYVLSAISFESPRAGRGGIYLTMRARHAAVLYFAPAVVGPTSIKADLGAIGRIDIDFVSSGKSRTAHSDCDGKPVLVDTGHYEGTIDFEGEEGYSEVHASSAPGEVKEALNLICSGSIRSEGTGGHSPGARLTVLHRHGRRFEFGATKNSPSRPARFIASISEHRGRLSIIRGVEATGAAGSFDFDVRSGTADVNPPEPFAGEASYLRLSGKKARWRGDLSVDFPGQANVRLTGAGTRAGLVRAVLNPSHPFRVQ